MLICGSQQTETLKNLFVLYFSILKHPGRTPLLSPALEGISQFAHHINIDLFRDLLAVLRKIIIDDESPHMTETEGTSDDTDDPSQRVRLRLLAIVTSFDLLSGQGEALNIDLGDFINSVFALLRPLSLDTGIEDLPLGSTPSRLNSSTSDLMFSCVDAIFFSKSLSRSISPPWRMAAFAKRLMECSLLLPPKSAKRAVEMVRMMCIKETRLEGMLDTEERTFDGVYKAESDDPQLCNPFATSMWEIEVLARGHWDEAVRTEAGKLRDGKL